MHQHVAIYYRVQSGQAGTLQELSSYLRQTVENRGDIVVGTFADDGTRVRQRNTGWKALLANLDGVDQIAVASAGDLPGRSVRDLLKILDLLRENGVGLFLHAEGIDTGSSPTYGLLDIIRAYRRAKLSKAIKIGQAKAIDAGKVIGRPVIPSGVLVRIRICLAAGHGVRPTARRFNISPASVINIRRSMVVNRFAQAA